MLPKTMVLWIEGKVMINSDNVIIKWDGAEIMEACL